MGQVADDAVNGFACSCCGCYFENEHGYPVLCTGCHKEDKGKSGLSKATEEEL